MVAEIDTDLADALRRLLRALEEEGPARFRSRLARNLQKAAEPGAAAIRSRVMAIPSRAGRRPGGSIRRAITTGGNMHSR